MASVADGVLSCAIVAQRNPGLDRTAVAMRRTVALVATLAVLPASVSEKYLSYSCYEDAGLYPLAMGCRCNVGYFGATTVDGGGDYVSQDCIKCPVGATTGSDDKAVRSDCNCAKGYTGNIIDGGNDLGNECSLCAVDTFGPAAIGGTSYACSACPANSGTGTRTGRKTRADCLCAAQFTGDLGRLDLELPIDGTHPSHTGAIASIDAEAYGGLNSVTLGAADSSIEVGDVLQLADASGQTCAATPKGSDIVVGAVDGATLYFATDLTKGDASAATTCVITRAAPSCTNLVSQATGWADWTAMTTDGWVGSSTFVVAGKDAECLAHTGGESWYGYADGAAVGMLSWKFQEATGPGVAHLDFGNCWSEGTATATLTRIRDGKDQLLGTATTGEISMEIEFAFEAGDILTLRDATDNSVVTVNSLYVCAHGDSATTEYRDDGCTACPAGQYKDGRGTASCTPIIHCVGSWSDWTSGADLCVGGTDGLSMGSATDTAHGDEERRVFTVTQPYTTPTHGTACVADDGAVETRAGAGATRFGGDRWLTVDVTVEDRDALPDTVGGTASLRVAVVTIVPIAHGAATGADGIVANTCATTVVGACAAATASQTACEAAGACTFYPASSTCVTTTVPECASAIADQTACTAAGACTFTAGGNNAGIDPPHVTIDGVPVRLKSSERVSFVAEKAVSNGDCTGPQAQGTSATCWETTGTTGTCVEAASTPVSDDTALCAAVTALTDDTACDAVMTTADAAVAACTYSAGLPVAADRALCAAVSALDDDTACAAVMTTADGAVAACTYASHVTCDAADGLTATECAAIVDGNDSACQYVDKPLVSIAGLRSCASGVLEKSHEFVGLGHFRVWLPASPTTAAPFGYAT